MGAEDDAYTLTGTEAGIGMYPLNANIFEGLVRMDPGYGIVPVLATSWSVKGDTWTFKLREGVTFHDGRPFTAEAVKYAFDRIADIADGGSPGLTKKGTKVVDEYTIDVTPKSANPRMVEQLVHPIYSIVAPGTDPVKEQIGTGPFKLGSYKRQQEIVVERFAKYWGGAALLDKIQFKFLPEANARRLALEGGEVRLILGVPNETAASLKSKGFEVHVSPAGAYEAMYANIGGRKGYTLLQDSRRAPSRRVRDQPRGPRRRRLRRPGPCRADDDPLARARRRRADGQGLRAQPGHGQGAARQGGLEGGRRRDPQQGRQAPRARARLRLPVGRRAHGRARSSCRTSSSRSASR